LAGLKPLFDRYTGVMFVSDVAVSRVEYFSPRSTPEWWLWVGRWDWKRTYFPSLSIRAAFV